MRQNNPLEVCLTTLKCLIYSSPKNLSIEPLGIAKKIGLLRNAHAVLKNSQPFIHKINLWAYIDYSMQNLLRAYLPNPNMECNV